MIAGGFIDEVRTLLDHGYDRRLPAMSAVGYREIAAHLLDGLPLGQAIHDAKIATHRFIRRQLSWFRGHDHAILWHNRVSLDPAALVRAIEDWRKAG
mgnify:CR=1 FL=1